MLNMSRREQIITIYDVQVLQSDGPSNTYWRPKHNFPAYPNDIQYEFHPSWQYRMLRTFNIISLETLFSYSVQPNTSLNSLPLL
jgi:hypothetical protein